MAKLVEYHNNLKESYCICNYSRTIIGSDKCKACKYFINKIDERRKEEINGVLKPTLDVYGIVECSNPNQETTIKQK